ncbi:MAG: ricin-type beta-trefoil lectin domain protein, partial [Coriobacteriales bacterium]|nr:ricin-type beta-trefoil lectin domain protein [Coriobacteriales bacterium]
MVIDQQGGEGQGNKVIAWPCHNKANQRWRWMKDGTVRTNSGKFCLDVRGGKAASGAEVILWPCKGKDKN